MNRTRPFLASLVSAALILASPGLPAGRAFAAAAASARVPAAWVGVVARFNAFAQMNPMAVDPGVSRVLGYSHYELSLSGPAALPKLAFLAELPVAPQAFAALSMEAQAAVLTEAVWMTAGRLESEARALLAKQAGPGLDLDEEKRLIELAASFYYLPTDLAADLRSLAAELAQDHVQAKARGILSALAGSGKASDDTPAGAVQAELGAFLAGAAVVLKERQAQRALDPQAPALGIEVLRPFVQSALGASAARLAERGFAGDSLYKAFLSGHAATFDAWAGQEAGAALRRSGEWTDFVAMTTIEAASAVSMTLGAPGRVYLARLSAADHFRIKIPAFYELSKAHRTVGEWLEANYGRREAEVRETGFKLFSAFGIPVRADAAFLAVIGLIGWQLAGSIFPRFVPGMPSSVYLTQGLAAASLLYGSIVLHEFGHALTARLFGIKTKSITLNILGGLALLDREPRKAWQEFLVAVAGPAVNAAIAGLAFLALPLLAAHPLASAVLLYLMLANIMVGVFNMLPAFPMDGGRVLRAGLWGLMRDHHAATKAAAALGGLFGLAFLALGAYRFMTGDVSALMMILVGFFVRKAAKQASVTPSTKLEG